MKPLKTLPQPAASISASVNPSTRNAPHSESPTHPPTHPLTHPLPYDLLQPPPPLYSATLCLTFHHIHNTFHEKQKCVSLSANQPAIHPLLSPPLD
ncbi:hypothetical protein E2C01_067534 [Portunus trituberculatus]|uniref:Uncharacterized protein n=1 Tax=Portunus trituberculatus TaxID=210409 RepID=A0A5B7HPK0_PORTR|nr:hypothetical protein [Portunus trituberculatus]